ncbi:hypothetical protein DPEC_G00309540, partial [Dallia pectoralis]
MGIPYFLKRTLSACYDLGQLSAVAPGPADIQTHVIQIPAAYCTPLHTDECMLLFSLNPW